MTGVSIMFNVSSKFIYLLEFCRNKYSVIWKNVLSLTFKPQEFSLRNTINDLELETKIG